MKRYLSGILIAFLVLDAVLITWGLYMLKYDLQGVVDIKYSLFTNYTNSRSYFNAPPKDLPVLGFKFDTQESIEAWSVELSEKLSYLGSDTIRALGSLDAVDKARSIIMLFSKNGSYGCSADISLMAKLHRLPSGDGYGCCTDHTEVFIAISSVMNLPAREVHTVGHVTSEFFDETRDKWIWIDPLYAIMARDPDGNPLSLFEIREAYFSGQTVVYEFFGNDFHEFRDKAPHKSEYFDSKEDFSDIMVTWGNNVFEEDVFDAKLGPLPLFVRQFVGIFSGTMPSYLMYTDEDSTVALRLQGLRQKVTALIILLAAGNLLYPVYALYRLIKRKGHSSTQA